MSEGHPVLPKPRECKFCGELFQPRHPNAHTRMVCYETICKKWWRAHFKKTKYGHMWEERKCVECGKPFFPKTPHHIFCRVNCGRKARRKKFIKCEVCGIRFLRQKTRKYCSEECGKEAARRKRKSWELRKPTKLGHLHEPRICSYCEKKFIPKHGNQLYCSPVCAQKRKEDQFRSYRKKQDEWGNELIANGRFCKRCERLGRETELYGADRKNCPRCRKIMSTVYDLNDQTVYALA